MSNRVTHDVDIAIVGSGFSGSLLAMIARQLGRSVALIERGHHPRFAIGESSTPLTSLLLEEIAREYGLTRLLPLGKYGSWRRTYPDVGVGLKRGFSFFRHDTGQAFATNAARDKQLLVAASPHDEIGDVHWYRPDFDLFFVREAMALGATYLDGVQLTSFDTDAGGARLLADGLEVRAQLVVDATGPRGFLHRQLGIGERELPGLPPTQTLFTHFTGVHRFADIAPTAFDATPPYAPDDAAVHHVFDGGWIWVLRFDNGITSAGIAATTALADELRLHEGAAGWARLMARFPSVGAQFADAKPTREFTWWPKLAFFSGQICGERWVALPSAAGIVDPLLSTGFPLTLLGVQRVARALAEDWGTPRLTERFSMYADRSARELETTSRLVGALYDAFGDWERFTALTFLYFAAASFAESARRLGNAAIAGDGFLLSGHATFADALGKCLQLATVYREDRSAPRRQELLSAIRRAIAPVNVAGLDNPARHNWYAAEAGDLFANAAKLGATEPAIQAMLTRCGFFAPDVC